MAIADLTDWMNEYGRPGNVWYAKRLSGNDTLANDSHQAGPYIPKEFLFRMFPPLNQPDAENPDYRFDLYIDSHSDHREIRAIWYNNRLRGGTRNETRLTGFGGKQSALLDPDSTGALAIFAFVLNGNVGAKECHVWVCRNEIEEDLVEERLGPVEPKLHLVWQPGDVAQPSLFEEIKTEPRSNCRLTDSEIPSLWLKKFPSGEEIIRKTFELQPLKGIAVDERLTKRRRCEFEIFQSIEEAVHLPKIKKGFETIESFLGIAQTILQSRKSRSGTSLELHVRDIMIEEGLRSGSDFTHRPVVEGNKRPDFLFPSKAAYDDPAFPSARLRMLAAKTTCKDRWRQITSEADRISKKHLLTLQEGISEPQFREMQEAGVLLVVPSELHDSFPKAVRPNLISFESFIGDIRLVNLSS